MTKKTGATRQPYLSVCISTYEMRGLGQTFLRYNFEILKNQTFKDFEVIISDQSSDDEIKKVCDEYVNILDIHYFKIAKVPISEGQNMPINTNNAMRHAGGKLIKILFLDDFLASERSLEEIVRGFDINTDHWLVTGCAHSYNGKDFFAAMKPRYHDKIYLGKNTISCPSVLTIKNENVLLLDTNLVWLMDCDHYKRYYDMFGPPKILRNVNVINRIGQHQTTNVEANEELREKEYAYILKKYGHSDVTLKVRRFKKKMKKFFPVLTRVYVSLFR